MGLDRKRAQRRSKQRERNVVVFRGISKALSFFELSAETVALPVIPNAHPRARKAARSNRESVPAL
jgi:hypothetical protein